jgi:hypothetical protein
MSLERMTGEPETRDITTNGALVVVNPLNMRTNNVSHAITIHIIKAWLDCDTRRV